ncbi:MAG: ribonuclease P protein component [Candidatus Paceibacterota bacterium]
MLPKSERLTKQDFTTFRPKGMFRGTYVDIASTPSPSSKFSCVIAKKRIKRAVDRNRVSRKVYAILEEVKPSTPRLIVVYPKVSVLTGNKNLIQEEIRAAFATL